MKQTKVLSSLMLLLTAFIWGLAFVAQSEGTEFIGPFTLNFTRFLLGGFVLIPVILLREFLSKKQSDKISRENNTSSKLPVFHKNNIIGGICCGAVLGIASSFQQFGLMHTTVGKAGFITTLYVIFVPILGIFIHKKAGIRIWISAGIAIIGLYLLCMQESLTLSKGDILILVCAIIFSVHVMTVDYFSPKGDGVVISCIQFFTCAFINGIGAFVLEQPRIENILASYICILYLGVLSCGVAYTLQVVAQKNTDPTVAALTMSLESVIAAAAGVVLLGQYMNAREVLGCVLVFGAVILAQIPLKALGRNAFTKQAFSKQAFAKPENILIKEETANYNPES